MLPPAVAAELADGLRASGYNYEEVAGRLGQPALHALARNTTLSADRALAHADDPQATLIRAFALQQSVPTTALATALGDLTRFSRLLRHDSAMQVSAAVAIRPYAFSDHLGECSGWLASDLTPTLDGQLAVPRDDFVLGVSPASVTLAELTMRDPRGRALDLGSGCGVQALHLARHSSEVFATDLNRRACALTTLTAALNGIELDVRTGSLYEPVRRQTFDLIVTNPPYVMAPPAQSRLVYREGSFTADGLVRAVVTEGADRLNPGGALQVLGNWAITADQPWEERLAEWIAPTGCDALVLQRERLDPAEYIEIWLADAGLTGTAEYASRYAEWLDYFDSLSIIGVGLGWLTLYRTEARDPVLRFDDWPHRVGPGVGDGFAGYPAAARAAALPDADLLATRWRCDPAVITESSGRPGAADPEHIVFRRPSGFGRAVEVGTALAAVVGACDGDLPLDVLIDAVAGLLDADPAVLRAELTRQLRPLIADGFLYPADALRR